MERPVVLRRDGLILTNPFVEKDLNRRLIEKKRSVSETSAAKLHTRQS